MRTRAFLLLILAVGLALRLAAVQSAGPSTVRFGDGPDYMQAAESLCSTGSYPDRGSMPFFRAPGLPFFIAVVTLCHPDAVWLIKGGLVIADLATIAVIYAIAEWLFADAVVSLVAAAAAAVYPYFIAQVSDVQTEALFMFFLLVAVWFCSRSVRGGSARQMLWAGACAGCASLVRPTGLLLIPFLAACPHGGKRFQPVAYLLVGATLWLGPWVVRNEIRYGEFILVNDAGGYAAWRGTSPEMAEIARVSDPAAFARASLRFERELTPALAREVDQAAHTPSTRSREWFRRAFANFRREPGAFSLRLARNAAIYWRPWLDPRARSLPIVIASGVLTTLLYVLAVMGWSPFQKREPRLALWLASGAVLFWLTQIPFQMVPRFRIPISDPFLIVFAAAAVRKIAAGWRTAWNPDGRSRGRRENAGRGNSAAYGRYRRGTVCGTGAG